MMRAALLITLLLVACAKKEPGYVAKLEELVSQVERMPGATAPWQAARVGDKFALGSAVRTGAASHARLKLGKRGVLDVDANAIVHFSKQPGRTHSDLRVETGNVEIETGDESFGIGQAVLEPNGRAEITSGQDGMTIKVTLGRALLDSEQGPVTIAAGKSITVPTEGRVSAAAIAIAREPAKPPVKGGFTVAVTGAPARLDGDKPLAIGEHRLEPGVQIEAPAGSVVEVRRDDGSRAVTSGAAKLRVGGGVDAIVTIASGTMALHAATADAVAAIPGGSVTARAGGSEVAIRSANDRTEVEAMQGRGAVRTASGEQALELGELATISSDGKIELGTQAPARAMISIAAGESPVVHVAKAPSAVRVSFASACPGAATLEIGKDRSFKKLVARSRGSAGANVLLPAGSFSYRVRCEHGKTVNGTLRIARDSGRAPLPKTAARTLVEADGREYTILYENLLPELTLAWRDAPDKGRYQFVVQPGSGKPKKLPSATPRLSLRSGELGEGSHKFWVENAETGRRSEVARIVIEFNNAAASASIESVEIKDGKVRVKGSVIEGSSVTAAGTAIELDRHRRFNAEIAPQGGEDGVGVRIAHPKLGIHYYVVAAGGT